MDRMTYKNYIDEYEVNFEKNSDKQWSIAESDTHIKITGEPIDKLGAFEDFMEELGVKSLKELKEIFNIKCRDIVKAEQDRWIKMLENRTKTEQENEKLKDRWQKLTNYLIKKEKTKVTKFAFLCRNILDKMQELEDVSDKGEL